MTLQKHKLWFILLGALLIGILMWSMPVFAADGVSSTRVLSESIAAHTSAPTAIVISEVKTETSPFEYVLILQAMFVVMGTVAAYVVPPWRRKVEIVFGRKASKLQQQSEALTSPNRPSSPLAVAPQPVDN